jgi:triacylglycerol lipase
VSLHHVYLVPGMFGFARLAGYDYFGHVRHALEERYAAAGHEVRVEVVGAPPTSSIRHRARIIVRTVQRHAVGDGPIHLLGHSTGGLDARLLLSPGVDLRVGPDELRWLPRVRTAVSLNTPHYGTPLASYFATVSGTRVLYAISLLTVISLSLGTGSLSVFARTIAALGGIERLLGNDLRVLGRIADVMLRYVDSEGRIAVETYLNKMRLDQGAIIQITPEAMDLFNAATRDADGVGYASVLTAAPNPKALMLGRRIRSPYGALSATLFSTLHTVTGQRHVRYGYGHLPDADRRRLQARLGLPLDDATNDAIVPALSMIWGAVLWCGAADHLDIIGHFHEAGASSAHVDWLTSGAHFDRARFGDVMDAVVGYQLAQST